MSNDDFYPTSIEISSLDKSKINLIQLDQNTTAAATFLGAELKIFRDVCPHMGAKFTDGVLCKGEKTIQCPWHGYGFSLEGGEFTKNPNDEIFAPLKTLYKSYKPEKAPQYRLRFFDFEMRDGRAYVLRSSSAQNVSQLSQELC